VFGYSCRYTFYHTQNNNHLDQNIGIICLWHKRSILVNDNTTECNVSQEKKKLSRNCPRWRYRHDNPVCRLLKTSQESCEWLISLRLSHRVLISSPLSPSQKECEATPSKDEKNVTVFANRISWKKAQSLHSQKLPWWAQQIYATKEKILTPNAIKKFCMQAWNISTNPSPGPSPARSEKPGLTYNSAPCQTFHS